MHTHTHTRQAHGIIIEPLLLRCKFGVRRVGTEMNIAYNVRKYRMCAKKK